MYWSDGEQPYLYEKHDGYSRHSGDEGTSVTHVMVPDLCWRSASRGSGARRIGKKKMRNDMEIERVPIAQLKPVVEIAHRTKDDALGGVAVILARSFVAGNAPPRAGRTQSAISRRTSSRWPLLTDGLASYQGKSVPCSSDFNSLFRRVGNFSANTLILLQPG